MLNIAGISIFGLSFYLLFFWIQLPFNLPLIVLSFAAIATVFKIHNFNQICYDTKINAAILIFFGLIFFSILWTESYYDNFIKSFFILPAIVTYFLIINLDKQKYLETVYFVLTILSYLLNVYLITSYLINDIPPFQVIKKIKVAIFIVPNDIIFLVLLVPFSLYFINKKSFKINIALASLVILSFLNCYLYQSRGALLSLTFCIFSFLFLLNSSYLKEFISISLIGFIVLEACNDFTLLLKFVYYTPRLVMYYISLLIFIESPLFGHGRNSFGELYTDKLEQIDFPNWVVIDDRFVSWPHNLYLEVLIETGLLGFIIFCYLIYIISYRLYSIFQCKCATLRYLSISLISSMGGFILSGFYELSFLRQWVVILLFIFAGITTKLYCLKLKEENACQVFT